MSFDWSQYLNLANVLHGERGKLAHEEACLRTAISRAYYAAFCAARNRARDIDGAVFENSGMDHELVRKHYLSSLDKQKRGIGAWLDKSQSR